MDEDISKVLKDIAVQILKTQSIVLQNESDLHYVQIQLIDFLNDEFGRRDINRLKIVLSELGTNILKYAVKGKIIMSLVKRVDSSIGMKIEAIDKGPGIFMLDKAMKDNYSTGKSLGLGLPGIKRLSDEFQIVSEIDSGTHVVLFIWLTK
jgi:serine/threonine-protein kinase RsbT